MTKSIKLNDVENPVTKQAAKRLMDSYGQEAENPFKLTGKSAVTHCKSAKKRDQMIKKMVQSSSHDFNGLSASSRQNTIPII